MSPIPLRCLACDETFAVSTRVLAQAHDQLLCPMCGSPRIHVDMLHPPMRLVSGGRDEEYEDDPYEDEPNEDELCEDERGDDPGARDTGT
jgi:hypothetical protein